MLAEYSLYQIVVQLKDNEIDTTKTVLANAMLGDVVPISSAALTKCKFAYISRFIPGTVWALREHRITVEENAQVAAQVGNLIARCTLDIGGSSMVDGYVIPRLRRILSKADLPRKLAARVEELVGAADGLKGLPLSLCHIDINTMNIILDQGTNIVGLIDWELAQLLPTGMNAWCIRYLAVPIQGGVDQPHERSQPMAEAFWQGLIDSLPAHLYNLKDKIVDAMLIGLLLFTWYEGHIPGEGVVRMIPQRLEWIESTFRPLCAA